MFSTEGQLRRRTGKYDAPRFEYLQALVTEFQDTTDAEAKRQVLANLANFAYDPINYDHFRKLNVLDLFLDVLSEPDNDQAVEFAMGGLCNCCLDPQFAAFILENDGVPLVAGCLGSANLETVLSAITTLYYLLTPSSLDLIAGENSPIVECIEKYSTSKNVRLSNLSKLCLQQIQQMKKATQQQ
ncbi:Armadillo repeat-containing protein 7 [Balamuthia mandrillaris]